MFVETTHAFCSLIFLSRDAQRLRGALVDQTRGARAARARSDPPRSSTTCGGASRRSRSSARVWSSALARCRLLSFACTAWLVDLRCRTHARPSRRGFRETSHYHYVWFQALRRGYGQFDLWIRRSAVLCTLDRRSRIRYPAKLHGAVLAVRGSKSSERLILIHYIWLAQLAASQINLTRAAHARSKFAL